MYEQKAYGIHSHEFKYHWIKSRKMALQKATFKFTQTKNTRDLSI